MRTSSLTRETKETSIRASLTLDNEKGGLKGSTGVGFFDHMLNSFCVHGSFILEIEMSGDLYVDCHHTIEDVGIVLGNLFKDVLGDRSGIARFGESHVPMDEALAFCAIDISGRPYLVYNENGYINSPMIGGYDTEMTEEFFRAFSFNAGFTLHLNLLYGKNAHHCVEALYKAAARAVKAASTVTGGAVLSAKGVL
ncbi:MAG: imidazoleglycerol-phosphate dehydratase HisB [Ruminococcaceae bacterium]|nr:imidazoleglycerol-phosphate dehydratase HisB [Oscillospiraceae bacterium]